MIDFLKYKRVYFLFSLGIIIAGLYSLITFGYIFSIDFTGGSVIEYELNKPIKNKDIKNIFLENNINIISLKINHKKLFLKTSPFDEKTEKKIREALEKSYRSKINLLRFETVGPTLGKETINKTIIAAITAIFGILIYLTFAFKNIRYGLAAILAMIHDFLIMVGVYSLFSKYFKAEFDTLFVTALLTTMSFSVHDTIVVFDKIREYQKIGFNLPFNLLANKALTETIVRSLNNSLTIILMLVALLIMGGESIKFFVASLLVGTITGTYSSPFIATPILSFLETKKK